MTTVLRHRLLSKANIEVTPNSLIILVVVILFFIGLFMGIMEVNKSANEKQQCELANAAAAADNKRLESFGNAGITASTLLGPTSYALSCPATFIYLQEKDMRTISANERILAKNNGYTDNDFYDPVDFNIKKELASQLANCYGKIGANNSQIFDSQYKVTQEVLRTKAGGSSAWSEVLAFAERTATGKSVAPPTFCAMCAKIQFDDQLQSKYSTETSFLQAAQRTKILRENNRVLTQVLLEQTSLLPDYSFSAKEPLAIIYAKRYPYQSTLGETATYGLRYAVIGVAIGTVTMLTAPVSVPLMAGTLVVGAFGATVGGLSSAAITLNNANQKSDPFEGFIVLPYSEVSSQCDLLANSYSSD